MSRPTPGPDRLPPGWGGPLTEDDYITLAKSWITREIADAAMLRRVDTFDGREIVGQKGKRDCAGLLFPYYFPGETHPHSYRIRRDHPEWTEKVGKLKPNAKYLAAPGSANRLYIPPGVTREQLADTQIAIVITEGEKKALALWRLANHETERPRFIPIAISGVWNWRGTTGKAGGPNGERLDVKGPINDLNRIVWGGRRVFIVFDTNVHTNESVKWARSKLGKELATRRAEVKFVNLPADSGVNGIDDLLALWGPARVLELFEAAVSAVELRVIVPPQFQSRPDGLFRVTTQGQRMSQIQLTTFPARILANIQLDDGVETRREFEIEATVLGQKRVFTIPASDFIGMNWAVERLGSAAIVLPNQRDYARAAIQSLSLMAVERCIYAHTGWRKVDGRWLYLHAGGAIGAGGFISDVIVRLSGTLSRYEFPAAATTPDLKQAVAASLRLADLGPASISLPLLAATFRAVFGGADLSLHLVGETGTFKSALAAIHQQHFGLGMDRLHLPANWSSTANALEALAFHAKDALLVVDDFAPQGNSADIARYHASADRLFRGAGNHAGRGRLDSASRLRESKPPRALILSTGEEIPRGQSVRARLLILEISKGDISGTDLARCQSDAVAGLYAVATACFLQWLAGRFEQSRAALETKVEHYRSKALFQNAHARTPEIVANLQAGFDLYLEFAVTTGAIDVAEAGRLADRCWRALCDAAAAQVKHQGETEPTARFLSLVQSVLSSGRAHLEARAGGEPDRASESCGWRRDRSGNSMPLGDGIGWVDSDHVYLEPTAAFRAVQTAARESGEPFAISEQMLKKRLREKGLLASIDSKRQTLTIRRLIGGCYKGVLHLRRTTILPDVEEEPDDGE